MSDHFAWLEEWYQEQCDGFWEHEYGITITTLEDSGWSIEIELAETDFSEIVVERASKHRSDNDWIDYEVREQKFIGACGPLTWG